MTPRISSGQLDVQRTLTRFAVRDELIAMLINAPRSDAIGAGLAVLLQAAQDDPGQLRAVLCHAVDHNGQRTRIVDVLTQVAM